MSTILDNIVATRRQALERARLAFPLERVQQRAEAREERRDFAAALSRPAATGAQAGLRVIAELKRASPSRGTLRQDYDCRELAAQYAAAGAAALSVLTEEQYFRGSTEHLTAARRSVAIPVLRKDFILEDYQVYESVAVGADALLLIVAILPDRDLRSLLALCNQLRVAALVEVHTAQEADRAAAAGARIIGVNNRNLKTLEVTLETSFELRSKIPRGCLAVSESGIKTAADLQRIQQAGFHAVLIGERFMTEPDPGAALRGLLAEFAGTTENIENRKSKSENRNSKIESRNSASNSRG